MLLATTLLPALLTLLTLLSHATAQAATSVFAAYPTCAQTCLSNFYDKSSCAKSTDPICSCTNVDYIQLVTACIMSACSTADQGKSYETGLSLCERFGADMAVYTSAALGGMAATAPASMASTATTGTMIGSAATATISPAATTSSSGSGSTATGSMSATASTGMASSGRLSSKRSMGALASLLGLIAVFLL